MTLMQLHWQWIDKCQTVKTEMMAQREVHSTDDLQRFISETQHVHPLPEGVLWLACTEQSEHFAGTVNDDRPEATQ